MTFYIRHQIYFKILLIFRGEIFSLGDHHAKLDQVSIEDTALEINAKFLKKFTAQKSIKLVSLYFFKSKLICQDILSRY